MPTLTSGLLRLSALLLVFLPKPAQDSKPASAPAPSMARVDRGPGVLPLYVPRDEELRYNVHVKLGPVSTDVGHVWLSTGTKPFQAPLLLGDPHAPAKSEAQEIVWIRARAKAGYAFYESDSVLQASHLPQLWPRIRYTHAQKGTEERNEELLIGTRDGKPSASFRKDTDKDAPRGTRIWRDPKSRKVPAESLDMLSASHLVRGLYAQGLETIELPLIDKLKLWNVTMKKGAKSVQKTPSGEFDAVELVMITRRAASEAPAKEAKSGDERFEGPFGIHGEIKIYLEERTGVPVRFEGTVPLGLFDLHANIELEAYSGTPAAFAPRPASAKAAGATKDE